MRRNILLALLLALLAAGCGRKVSVKDISVVPEPVFSLKKEGTFTLGSNPRVSTVGMGQNSPTAKYILKSMRSAHLHPSLVASSESSDIEFIVNDTTNPEIGDEGYLLEVRSSGIRISANTETGIFYGYQTLIQMLPSDVSKVSYRSVTMPECTVLDYPRFEWRGAKLDVCHNFLGIKHIKRFLDVMASYKLNRFHWMMADSVVNRMPTDSVDGDSCYTAEEIAEVVAYAAGIGIEVVTDTVPAGVLSPEEYCRFDMYQADERYQPQAAPGRVTLAQAYMFDPVPEGTISVVAKNIVGGECTMGTRYTATMQDIEYMLLPRMLATAECLWSQRDTKDWNRFRRKVERQKDRLQAKGFSYCDGSFTPQFTVRRVNDKMMNVSITTEVPNTYIFYTTDLSTPTRQSLIYIGPVNLARGTHIKILPVYNDIERDSVYEFLIK